MLAALDSRRWFLQTGVAGIAGVSLPELLRRRAEAAFSGVADRKAVILIWLSGGPSQLDTWDPKPDAPAEIRGPFNSISTKIPGVRFSEHLPLQAGIGNRINAVSATGIVVVLVAMIRAASLVAFQGPELRRLRGPQPEYDSRHSSGSFLLCLRLGHCPMRWFDLF